MTSLGSVMAEMHVGDTWAMWQTTTIVQRQNDNNLGAEEVLKANASSDKLHESKISLISEMSTVLRVVLQHPPATPTSLERSLFR